MAGLLSRIFLQPAQTSAPARALLGIPLVLIALKKMRKKPKKQVADGEPPKPKKPDPIGMLWREVWPSWLSLDRYMIVLIVGNAIRVYIANLIANNVRLGDGLLFTRDMVKYRSFVVYSIKLSLCNNLVENFVTYVRDQLARKWRAKLTKNLQDEYFASANYYHAEQHMKDSDVRMTTDVKSLAEGFTEFFTAGTYTATTGVFYSLKVFWEFGFFYMSAPYIYFFGITKVQPLIGKMNWGLYVQLEGVKAKFRTAQTRLLQHSEAIAALKGASTEKVILGNLFDDVIEMNNKVFKTLVRYGASMAFCYQHMMGLMYEMFVIGPGTFRGGGEETVEQIAQIRADVGYQFVLFIQMMSSVGSIVRIYEGYKRLTGNAARYVEFRANMAAIAKTESETEGQQLLEGDSIKFTNCMIYTPAKDKDGNLSNKLVHDLTFEVGKQDSMLLTGHNGAGKSSVFRCLAGLWKIPEGQIQKPGMGDGDNSLAGTVFYLPQKPYNVLGTLVDQLTYPELGDSSRLSKDQVKGILEQVDLGYLAERPDVMTTEINWEEHCSLGEKQRLAIARLIWHKPEYAILDECTSAVSTAMEERLYWLLADNGITYITISHRPVLRSFHLKMLCINGDKDKTYTYEQLQTKTSLENHVKTGLARYAELKASTAQVDNTDMANVLKDRSRGFEHVVEDRNDRKKEFKIKFDKVGVIPRFFALMTMGLKRAGLLRIAGLTVLTFVRLFLSDFSMTQTTMFFMALMSRNKSLLYKTIGLSFIRGVAQTVVDTFQKHTERKLQVEMLTGMTTVLQDKVMSNNSFYTLKNIDGRVEDMDNRISDDVSNFSETVSSMWSQFAYPLVRILWFAGRFARTVDRKYAILLWGYLGGAVIVLKFIMPNYKQIVADQSALEGKYKFVHSRVRTHSESIAFFGGGQREKLVVQERYKMVDKALAGKANKDLAFNVAKRVIIHTLPDRVMDYVRFSHALDNFTDADLIADSGASLSVELHNIWATTQVMLGAIQELLEFSDKVAAVSGIVVRIAEFNEVLDDLATQASAANKDVSDANRDSPVLGFEGVDLVTPGGECLAKKLSITIEHGKSLMVTGPNAAGKSSFFRAMGGLWPSYTGEVFGPRDDVFLVPQRVYSSMGTLADQITYPQLVKKEERTKEQEDKMMELLTLVGIQYLVDREGGWDAVRVWEDTLSLGEQQRLGMARLFYNKPKYGVLDECTSAVSVDVERRLYKAAIEMGITSITISQRLALTEFHEKELRLGELTDAGWSLHSCEHRGDDGVGEVAEADGGAGFSFGVAKQRLGVKGAEAADAYTVDATADAPERTQDGDDKGEEEHKVTGGRTREQKISDLADSDLDTPGTRLKREEVQAKVAAVKAAGDAGVSQ